MTGSGPGCWSSRRCDHCNLWFERRAARARIVSGNRAAAARVGTSFASCSATSGSGSGRWSAQRCDNCNLWFERRAITRATTVSGRRAAAALVGARGRDVITKREITAQTRHHRNRAITTPQPEARVQGGKTPHLSPVRQRRAPGKAAGHQEDVTTAICGSREGAARARIVSGNRAAAARVGTSFASCSATSGSGSGRWSARRCDNCNLWFERRAITRATTVSGRQAAAALVGARGNDVITKREITAQTRHYRNRAITIPQPEARVQGGKTHLPPVRQRRAPGPAAARGPGSRGEDSSFASCSSTTGSGPGCWLSRRCDHCNLWFERRAARARIVSGNRAAAARVGTSFASCSATSGSGSGRWSARRCDNCNLWFERRAITRATTVSGRRAAAALVGARRRDVITKREITAQTRHHRNRAITTPQPEARVQGGRLLICLLFGNDGLRARLLVSKKM
ncbi:hypothetical protein ACOMHN_017099 [Nucella lapillus]